ncbi:hypothetical protein AB0J52_03435 [Spirillospora sp. NPDC049652]
MADAQDAGRGPGRPANEIEGQDPIAEFARRLRALQGARNQTWVAQRSGLAKSTVSAALGGKSLATKHTVECIVQALGADPAAWLRARQEVADQLASRHGRSGENAGVREVPRPRDPALQEKAENADARHYEQAREVSAPPAVAAAGIAGESAERESLDDTENAYPARRKAGWSFDRWLPRQSRASLAGAFACAAVAVTLLVRGLSASGHGTGPAESDGIGLGRAKPSGGWEWESAPARAYDREMDSAPFSAGARFRSPTSGKGGCSTGFGVHDTAHPQRTFLLVAARCVRPGETATTAASGRTIGTVEQVDRTTGIALISAPSGHEIYDGSPETHTFRKKVTGPGTVVPGGTLCITGAAHFTHCLLAPTGRESLVCDFGQGRVGGLRELVAPAGVDAAGPADVGAALFVIDDKQPTVMAMGLLIASTDGGPCTPGSNSRAQHLYYVPIQTALEVFRASLNTGTYSKGSG